MFKWNKTTVNTSEPQVNIKRHIGMLPIRVYPGDTLKLTYNLNLDARTIKHLTRKGFESLMQEMVRDRAHEIYDAIQIER